MKPSWTIAEAYGAGLVLNPRVAPGSPRWLFLDPIRLDLGTGTPLVVAGDLPVLCHATVCTARALSLLEACGLPVAARLVPYRSAAEYRERLAEVGRRGQRVICWYPQPEALLDTADYWIPRSLLCALNDKANLPELVPEEHVVPRRTLAPGELDANALDFAAGPVVLKGAGPLPNGGGGAVRICASAEEVRQAARELSDASHLILEPRIDIRDNVCVNMLADPQGDVHRIGIAEQVIDPRGRFEGTRIEIDDSSHEAAGALAARIMRRAADRGYRGVAGFDIVRDGDGRLFALDLNFRWNASTNSLLLADALASQRGARVLHTVGYTWAADYDAMATAIRDCAERGWLVPFATFDPAAGTNAQEPARFAGVVSGETHDEVEERKQELVALGFR